MQELFQKLNYLDKDELKLVKKCFNFANFAHLRQKRFSGEPYINHSLRVVKSLADLKMDSSTVCAALLHDVPEDTSKTLEDIRREFGREIANLVDGVTKLGKVRIKKAWFIFGPVKKEEFSEFERQIETLRKMFLAMSKDVRIILIKLYDRFDNMQTLNYVPKEKQKRIAEETLKIFAPLAYRLGIGELKGQLEDLAFPYVYPEEYQDLKKEAIPAYQARDKHLEKVKRNVAKHLAKEDIKFDIHGRSKHLYSLYKKLQKPKYSGDLGRIYDLVALRIIVDTIEQCYRVLGILHKLYTPIPGEVDDYIALPKPNGYQSLHTTLFCENGKIVEFQIRTLKMHEHAEKGVAAHWQYSEDKKSVKVPKNKLVWLKELNKFQKNLKDPRLLSEELQLDFFTDHIFVFTPSGDVKDLPLGATAVDFAYAVHTEIGHRCVGAKANGKIIPLDKPLESGQVIEILTSKNSRPKQDWLSFVKSSQARSSIRHFFKNT